MLPTLPRRLQPARKRAEFRHEHVSDAEITQLGQPEHSPEAALCDNVVRGKQAHSEDLRGGIRLGWHLAAHNVELLEDGLCHFYLHQSETIMRNIWSESEKRQQDRCRYGFHMRRKCFQIESVASTAPAAVPAETTIARKNQTPTRTIRITITPHNQCKRHSLDPWN